MEESNDNSYNYSDYSDNEDKSSVSPFQVFVASLYSIVFIIGVIGNVLVLHFTFKSQYSLKWTRFIFHIAVADLLFLLSLPFWAYDAMAEWIFGSFMCRAITALYMLGLYGSIFFMVLLTVHRYIKIICLFYQLKMAVVGFVWMLTLLASLPNVVFSREIKESYRTSCVHDFPSPAWRSFTFLNMNLLSFIIPLIIVVFCYSYKMHKYKRLKNDIRRRHITLPMMLVYFLFWAPYNITLFLIVLHTQGYMRTIEWSEGLNQAMQWVEIIAFSHCSLNPIIYALCRFGLKEKLSFQYFERSVQEPTSSL